MRERNLFEVSDYRSFLNLYVEEKKLQKRGWNLSRWTKTLGLSSTSSITKVLSGERNPGPDMVDRLVRYFKFTPEEERFFRNLVLLEKDKKSGILLETMMRETRKQVDVLQRRVLDFFEFRLIAEWHHISIRELFRLKLAPSSKGFSHSAKSIQKFFKTQIPVETVEKSIGLLQKLSLLKKDKDGKWFAQDEQIMTQNDISDEAIKMYHEQMLEQAKLRVRDSSPEDREFQSLALLIDRKDLPRIKQRIRDFAQGLEAEFKSKTVNQLYQFQMQMFPVSHEFPESFELNSTEQNNKTKKEREK